MKMSGRAGRMQAHHQRNKRVIALNLVSLMDIFTILVFFLLVNSSDVEVLPSTKDIEMPESIADLKPRESVVVMVTSEVILLQGKAIVSIAEVMNAKSTVIKPLQAALRAQTDRVIQRSLVANIEDREVTIMGDKSVPFKLLKKIMATCAMADYGRISLAVMQKSGELAGDFATDERA